MPRVRQAFRGAVHDVMPALQVKLSFFSVPNSGMNPSVLATREAKERRAVAALRERIEQSRTFKSLVSYMYTSHSAYSVSRLAACGDSLCEQPQSTQTTSGTLAESY